MNAVAMAMATIDPPDLLTKASSFAHVRLPTVYAVLAGLRGHLLGVISVLSLFDEDEFVESMKALGYPGSRLSMEGFRTPHFEMVADCIRWLISRYDPAAELDTDILTEEGRLAFLKSASQFMAGANAEKYAKFLILAFSYHQFQRTRVKLNIRNLYAADSNAADELLKVASMLQQATTAATLEKCTEAETTLFNKSFDVKAARSLVLEIIKAGATLYDDLATEIQLQRARCTATSTNTDIGQIENMMQEATDSLLQAVASVEQQHHGCEKDEKSLHGTYEKRKIEFERCKKRLSVLQNVRPAYLDEYEVLQKDLQRLFGVYLEKFHNLQWLESQLEIHNQEEQEKLQESYSLMRRLQQRMHDENLRILRGEEVGGNTKVDPTYDEAYEAEGSPCQLKPPTLLERTNSMGSKWDGSHTFVSRPDHPPSKDVSQSDSDEEVSKIDGNENEVIDNISSDDEF